MRIIDLGGHSSYPANLWSATTLELIEFSSMNKKSIFRPDLLARNISVTHGSSFSTHPSTVNLLVS